MLNELHLKTRHFWVTKIALNCVTEVTCVTNQSLTMTFDITKILVVSPQIRYIEVFDVTNPRFNEQIWPVPSDFVKSRFRCIISPFRHFAISSFRVLNTPPEEPIVCFHVSD